MSTYKNYCSLLCTGGGRLAALTADGSVDGIGGAGYKKLTQLSQLFLSYKNLSLDLHFKSIDCITILIFNKKDMTRTKDFNWTKYLGSHSFNPFLAYVVI